MPDQRTTAAVPAALRSVHPGVVGVPSWAAVLIGITGVLAGFAIEAGSDHRELGGIFTTCYVLGCLAAVLAVRQSGIFTAVIQPPLLLFVAVPLGYFLLHGAPFNGLKDALITCGYPLIERFPLMLFTSAAVLLIGMVRWYLRSHTEPGDQDAAPRAAGPGLVAGLTASLRGAFGRGSGEADERPARPRHVVDRSGGSRRAPRSAGRTERREAAPSARARRERPAREVDDREARPRRDTGRRPPRERDYREPYPGDAARQRRPRRDDVPPPRRAPRERRAPYEPRPGQAGGYESHDRYAPHDPYQARPPRPDARRPRADSSHHPVSRVRYRGGPGDGPDYRDPPRRER